MNELIKQLGEFRERFNKLWQVANVQENRQEIIRLQEQMNKPDFWQDQEKAKAVSQKVSDFESEVEDWEGMKKDLKDLVEITELDKEDKDVNLVEDLKVQLEKLEKKFNQMELSLLLSDKHDKENAIVAIHAGAGGTDAQDWAEMLLRMYLRFCEKQGWQTKIISISPGSEAGLKSILFEVLGRYSYGYLKSENGVHRLVRISPFDAEKMRHTSFALVEVLPHSDEEVKIDIDSKDLRIDTFRASGHGGQGVNTTDSAVRITHLPTQIAVSCQNERSQLQNKETALKILKAKLQKYYETELEEERQKLRGEYTEAAWGNQVRSYVLHPYKLAKDHRTDFESQEVENVLDGNLIEFVEAYLKNRK